VNWLLKVDDFLDKYLSPIPVFGAHWRTTLAGYAGAAGITAFNFAECHDYRDPKFWALMLAAVATAVKGRLAADINSTITCKPVALGNLQHAEVSYTDGILAKPSLVDIQVSKETKTT
jgi:hypothetical protein